MNLTTQFIQQIEEIIELADRHTQVADYKHDSLIRQATVGGSHDDRMRVLDFLMKEGLISVVDGELTLTKGIIPEWLLHSASKGWSVAYKLAEKLLDGKSSALEKFDQQALKEIGLAGEISFLNILRNSVPDGVLITHSSLFDDSLGYDIHARDAQGASHHFEVKTSSRPISSSFQFFLTRNEFEVALTSPSWRLACMQIEDGVASFIGYCPLSYVLDNSPVDKSDSYLWASSKIKVARSALLLQPIF